MHVVIDCDPGIDDAIAITMALSRQNLHVQVEAITVVDGNTALANALMNLAVILKYCSRTDIPVYKGSSKPLIGFEKVPTPLAVHIHGEKGLGTYSPNGKELDQMNLIPHKSAAEGLIELARKFSGQLHVIALGPLTNIALAIRLDPTFPQHLASLYIMGGDYGAAFKRLGAEFNFLKDPEAANIVMREAVGHCPVTLIPFDTCVFSSENCHWDWLDSAVNDNTDFGRFIHKLLVPFRNHVKQFMSCDAFAMAGALLPGAIEAAEQFSAHHCGVQLDHVAEPVKTERCQGGQRGCLILGKKIQNVEGQSNGNGSTETNDEPSSPTIQPPHRYVLRIATRINEHMFKTAFTEAVGFFSQKSLPHYGY